MALQCEVVNQLYYGDNLQVLRERSRSLLPVRRDCGWNSVSLLRRGCLARARSARECVARARRADTGLEGSARRVVDRAVWVTFSRVSS